MVFGNLGTPGQKLSCAFESEKVESEKVKPRVPDKGIVQQHDFFQGPLLIKNNFASSFFFPVSFG